MKTKWTSPKDKILQIEKSLEIKRLKTKINSKIKTNRQYVHFVNVGRDVYEISFQGLDIYISHNNKPELINDICLKTLELIVLEIEEDRCEADPSYQW